MPAYIDVDDDPSTYSSSRATLDLPAGAEVLWAGLYWGGAGDGHQSQQVRLARPTLGYEAVSATQLDLDDGGYQGFADVTTAVRAGGSGAYTVADVSSLPGAPGAHGGWALVVAVRDPAAPLRNLTVFDGFALVGPSGVESVVATSSGFTAPLTGAVGARVGVVAYGGSAGVSGDSLALGDHLLSDPSNPVDDVFNGSISRHGGAVGLEPVPSGPLSIDIDDIAAPEGAVANGANAATLSVRAAEDAVLTGVLTSVVDAVQAHLVVRKSAADPNGGALDTGDTVDYAIEVVNRGSDWAESVVLTDVVPEGSSFVAGSLQVDSGLGAVAATDQADADPARYDADTDQVVVGVGAGTGPASGGSLGPGGVTTVRFQVLVDGLEAGARLANQAQVTYRSATTGTSLSAASDDPARVGGSDATETPANAAPEAHPDEAVAEGQAVNVDVLANDVDSDGDPLSIGAVEAADVGTVSCPPSGPCTYRPPTDFAGVARFAYTVLDPAGNRSAAAVSVTVTPSAEPSPSPSPGPTPPDSATDSPPDSTAPTTTTGAPPTSTTGAPPTTGPPTPAAPAQPAAGAPPSAQPAPTTTAPASPAPAGPGGASPTSTPATTAPAGPPCEPPAAGQPRSCGTAVAGVALATEAPAGAGTGAAAPAASAALAANSLVGAATAAGAAGGAAAAPAQMPRAIDDQATTEAGRALAVAVLANDMDPDGDLVPGSVSVVRTPTRGSAAPTGEGAIQYTPFAGLAGPDELSYRVCDAGQRCAEAMVRLTVSQVTLPALAAQSPATTSAAGSSSATTAGSSALPTGSTSDGRLAGTGVDTRTPLAVAVLLIALGSGMLSEAHRLAPLAHRHRHRRRPRRLAGLRPHPQPQHRRSRWR